MLERRRVLVERGIQRDPDGSVIRIYEHRQTGESFLIREPELRLDQLESVQAEVVAMLGGDKATEEGAAEADDAPATESRQASSETPC
jgi:hypothetical protein